MSDYPDWVHPTTNLHCQAPGCTVDPRSPQGNRLTLLGKENSAKWAVEGTDLCVAHHARFPRVLMDLASLWASLENGLVRRGGGERNTGVQTSGIADLSQLWNPYVTEVMHELRDWVAFLGRTVVREHVLPSTYIHKDEHGTSTTTYTRWEDFAGSPRMALAVLAKHEAHWLSAYPGLGPSVLDDAITLRGKAMRALDHDPVRRVGLKASFCGFVLEDVELGQVQCLAPMVGILSDDNRPNTVMCSQHPLEHQQFTKDQWMELHSHAI